MEPPRDGVAFDQDAVDSVANAHPVAERLDMDVRGPWADRFLNDQVDQLHDGGVAFIGGVGVARSLRFR